MKVLLSFSILISCFFCYSANAQKRNLKKARQYLEQSQTTQALQSIQEACKHKRTKNKVQTWLLCGEIYQHQAINNNTATLLDSSKLAYSKAQKLDIKQEYQTDINTKLLLLQKIYKNYAKQSFQDSNYTQALYLFEQILLIDTLNNSKDTASLHNAALSAERANKTNKAIRYYQSCIGLKFGGPKLYHSLAALQGQSADTIAAINTLQTGIRQFPEDNTSLVNELLINYITALPAKEAIGLLKETEQLAPNNPVLHFSKGLFYQKLQQDTKAETAYRRAIELKPDYADACFNLASLFFNQAIKLHQTAENLPPKEVISYQRQIKASRTAFRKALPYLEKARLLEPYNKNIAEMLLTVYLEVQAYYQATQLKTTLNGWDAYIHQQNDH